MATDSRRRTVVASRAELHAARLAAVRDRIGATGATFDPDGVVAAVVAVVPPAGRRPPRGRKPPRGRRTPALGHLVPPGAMLAGPELPPPWEPRRPNGAIPRPGKPTKEEAGCCRAAALPDGRPVIGYCGPGCVRRP